MTATSNYVISGAPLSTTSATAIESLVSGAEKTDKGVLLIGGDHPYAQWGSNGVLQAYRDNGLKPYLAINTATLANSPDTATTPGEAQMWTWADQVASAGDLETVSHGCRHIQMWNRLNTGVRIAYSGVAATGTVLIATTGVTLTGNGGAENVTLLYSTYPTIAALGAAINAIAGGVWTCQVAPELKGTEPAGNLLNVAVARNAKPFGTNQLFAAGGGLVVAYTGTVYDTIWLHRTANPSLDIYADGVRLISYDLSSAPYNTLTKVRDAINAAGIAGLACHLADNGKAQTPTFTSYVQGDENSQNLKVTQLECSGVMASVDAGLSRWYMLERQFQASKDFAAAQGVNITYFAQSGDGMHQYLTDHDMYEAYRGNGYARTVSPYQVPLAGHDPRFSIMQTTKTNAGVPWTAAQFNAVIDALGDSGPFMVDLMCHKVLPDGSSGYSFVTEDAYYDMVEADFVAGVRYAGSAITAGKITSRFPTEASRARPEYREPRNYAWNPKFRNDGSNLLNANDAGFKMPGWFLVTPNTVFSAVSVANGEMTCTTTAATATTFLNSEVVLEPGATYELSATVDISTFTSGNGIRIGIVGKRGRGRDVFSGVAGFSGERAAGTAVNGARTQRTTLRFTVPLPGDPIDKVAGNNAGPYNLVSSPADIKLSIDAKTQLNINVAGATPTATKASEIVTAINNALVADAAYGPEYKDAAKVVRGKVVVASPYLSFESRVDSGYGTMIDAGTTNSATALIFGNATCRSIAYPSASMDTTQFPWYFQITSNMVGTFTISAPSVRKLEHA